MVERLRGVEPGPEAAQAVRAARPRDPARVTSTRSYVESLQDIPAIGDFVPSLGSMVIMIVFTMMAVGLNIVVGYAGLLDLGYVAFYAAGAYMAAWFASQQFDQWTFHFGSVGISKDRARASISRSGSCC